MNRSVVSAVALCVLAGFYAGCGSKPDAKTQLQKAAAVMAQPEPAQPAPPPTEQPPQPAESAPQVQTQIVSPAKEMNEAVASYKAGNLDDAVTRLQKLRATPVMSAEKRMALNDAMAAVMAEIYAMADKGDTRAIQAVKRYEEMQTQHR
jgi:hypothetical protein